MAHPVSRIGTRTLAEQKLFDYGQALTEQVLKDFFLLADCYTLREVAAMVREWTVDYPEFETEFWCIYAEFKAAEVAR